jgi:hypothetical protein
VYPLFSKAKAARAESITSDIIASSLKQRAVSPESKHRLHKAASPLGVINVITSSGFALPQVGHSGTHQIFVFLAFVLMAFAV